MAASKCHNLTCGYIILSNSFLSSPGWFMAEMAPSASLYLCCPTCDTFSTGPARAKLGQTS